MIRNAYAKINRFLFVTGKREDGYHLLHTVMQSVSLCDTLDYTADADPLAFFCNVPELS